MNRRLVSALGFCFIPVGAIILSACGPVETMTEEGNELTLDSASKDFVVYNGQFSEYGQCNDTHDNDGDGLTDSHDLDCHLNAGPMRDLSLFDFPGGHNFFPDVTRIPAGGPGFPGGFRDRAQITEWFRFLTEPDGYTAGTQLFGPGVNPAYAPIPMPMVPNPLQGTAAEGNNNNVSIRELHAWYLDHRFIKPPSLLVPAKAAAAELMPVAPFVQGAYPGARPGSFYKGGSQGYLQPAATGNPDRR